MGNYLNKDDLKELIPDHSRGSKLDDFLKDKGLSEAEAKLLYFATRGEPCVLGNGERPTSANEDNEIRASFLRYLILGGCSEAPLHQRGIDIEGAFISCPSGYLDLESTEICQDIVLVNCLIDGDVILYGTKCKTFSLQGSSVQSIKADGLEADGAIFLRDGFHASGEVNLLGAKIGKNLECRSGVFRSDIFAHNATIGGNIILAENFQLSGTLYLPNATIEGNIFCQGGTFHDKDNAILANKTIIKGNIILGNCNAAGSFAFQGAQIGGDFSAQGATLSAKSNVQLRNAKIDGTFHWRDVKHAPGMLDLGGATVKILNMDEKSWQKPTTIKLNNLSYLGFQELEEGANTNYWKRFLEKQPTSDLTNKFRPKPFEQLAGVLESIGFEQEAKGIRIERQRRQTTFMANHDPDRQSKGNDGVYHKNWFHELNVFWRKFISGPLVDYGFRPGKAALYLIALIFIGTGIYYHASLRGIMTPTHPLIFKEAEGGFIPKACADNWVFFPEDIANQCADAMPSEYSEFQSFIYAADVALPIVNFRMEADWAPRVVDINGQRHWHGWWVRMFEWFLIAAGWMLSLLFASAVGGIIRR